ncbi:hydroxymethylpyrimidine/phosphomethylpyrimidine kinase [Paractinoplanes abujensis]|uniref:Hydroxymethylpyrimidine/phosphomethylpyrimidine kinase n=1 Tax=Paractinoplanes abujensis TaxID=882441 RepID=A0A7W7CV93_9ACTN|nr:bifunctional hydroxymethylpyrimidine kinase/phosphomethylpyrimidine kinase [Actinoplanes abujensis]MBB4695325.1 hydroxymethylpyrimidine/phosphomethylpyrimidine kinase [Actinoplanes abujensis]GID24808.1 hydroxymethylpyrimidine/phosphomethylpyrimidine kinase [Actinoplanes abujensis]
MTGSTPPVVLTIAGSDSGGGAGIQADLKTFAALGAYGTSVLTAVTAQNTLGVTAIHPIPVDVVAAQLEAVLADLPVVAVKVGMIGDPAVGELIASWADRLPNLVVDPVLVATSGARLAETASVAPLLTYPCVLTPNRQEAAALVGGPVVTIAQMAAAAEELAGRGARAVVVTGSELAADVLRSDGVTETLTGEPVPTVNNHGSGCTFSSAIAVRLALGDPVPTAVRAAKRYVTSALAGGRDWRLGAGPGPLNHFAV